MSRFNYIRRLYDWVLSWAEKRYGVWILAVVSFAESSFFPIPPDPLLIALCLGSKARALYFALVCSVASVLGGLFGYAIGVLAFESVGRIIIDWYDAEQMYHVVQSHYSEHGFFYVFLAGFTPIPYKVFTIAAGVFELTLVSFILASVVSRAARFFLIAGVIHLFGESVSRFIDRWFNLLTIVFVVVLIGSFVLAKVVLG